MKILNEFGFCTLNSFTESLITPRFGLLFIGLSGITSIGDKFFGVSNLTLFLLLVLIAIELITGIWASVVRKRRIVSKKLQRFVLKIMIYFFFIMILHALSEEATDYTKEIYSYMYSFTILYFVFVHIKSILENYTRITGKKSDFLYYLNVLNSKVFTFTPKKKDPSDPNS